MKIFLAASYSSKVDYSTGDVYPEYREWLEAIIETLESFGHEVFCALKADNWRINDLEPAQAFKLDEAEISKADGMLALVSNTPSAGVQMEIGMAIAQKKHVVIGHEVIDQLAYFNQAVVALGQAGEVILPITSDPFMGK
jgi:nucleoside 2-deoxyribosyltransferase